MFKKTVAILFLVWSVFCILDLAMANAEDWDVSVNGKFGNILCVYGIDNTDIIYIGTDNGLYQTRDKGTTWSKLDVLNNSQVRDICVINSKVYAAGDNGIYESLDNRQWLLLNDRKDFKGLSFFQKEKGNVLLAWSCNKLFKIEKKECSIMDLPGVESAAISDVICYQDAIFLLLEDGLFYSDEKGNVWKKVLDIQKFDVLNENGEVEDIDDPALLEESFFVRRDIAPFGTGGIIVLVPEGVFVLDNNGLVSKKIKTYGLGKEGLKYIVYSRGNIFAASDKRIYYFIEEEGRWQVFFEESFGHGISCLKAHKDKKGCSRLWVSAGKYLYCRDIDSLSSSFAKKVSFMDARLTDKEIPINEVHKMAVEYAEVSPEKIRNWRKGAGWKAVMPKLSVGYSESLDDNTEIYTSSTTSYAVTGPRERNNDWGIDLSWDLANLIWNDDQTNIDVRSRLMVQLRDEILEEVTRLYFERKRLIKELDEIKHGDNEALSGKIYEKEIRIEELTAHIDAVTGGKFSKALNK